ncbi:MAG TPA: VWA domain-containing protein [Ignavibacteriaceae bacterium]|jgi:Ca-activated chloride channel family protein|nr:VWA domain-containing protein [Ignavibacteriaceae bacterium]HOJ19057.1 VWA domain-containing protein [Ignavibacteriaceae bacterium]HPO54508.1 VWA domain-containing protein [Ignavibacteriaceae bacterium]
MFDFDFTFAYPWMLLLLVLIPVIVAGRYFRLFKKDTSIVFSSVSFFEGYRKSIRERLSFLPFALRMLALAFLIIALARPQKFSSGENVYTEGIDIALVLDISGSMLAEDFKPNRLAAAKKITDSFIGGRTSDQIGLVIFSRDAFTQCPLTIDYAVLRNLLKDIKSGMIEDGTAIGNAIANGINRLKDSRAKSKVMILLTDGVNNAGEVNPVTAAEMAKQFGIRVYSIGIGTIGQAPYPFQTPFGIRYQMVPVEIDEPVLRQISGMTGAKYFRATNNKKLEEIYSEIDRLEKTRVEVTSYRSRKELFPLWIYLGLFSVLAEVILSKTYLRRLP